MSGTKNQLEFPILFFLQILTPEIILEISSKVISGKKFHLKHINLSHKFQNLNAVFLLYSTISLKRIGLITGYQQKLITWKFVNVRQKK